MYSFKRKSVPLKFLTFAAAIGYMGFAKSYLISITNIFSIVDWNWPVVKYNLAWYLFFGFTVVSTILWGRLYCGRVCAYGALTQTLDAVIPRRWRVDVPRSIERRAAWIKFGILFAVIAYYIVTRDVLIYQYVEPFWMFGLAGSTMLWCCSGRCWWRPCSSATCIAGSCARSAPRSACCRISPCSASSDGRSAAPAASARRRANGARSTARRSS